MNTIYKRVSVRKFKEQKVEQEKINEILKAAMQAPSAGNQQPWEFYVTDNKDVLEALSKASPYASCVKDAPLAIIPVYRLSGNKFQEYAQIDLSIACENIWLEATDLDLGCVWLGIAPLQERMDACDKILDLPDNLTTFAVMAIGYPEKMSQQQDRYDESRIHYIQ